MDSWLADAQAAIGDAEGAPLGARDAETLLELARIAAHTSGDRRNAPLLCYLVGLAVAHGGDLDAIAARMRAL